MTNHVGGPENLDWYWYPLSPELKKANMELRDLFNMLIEEKLKT
jgi:hypothetical protein